MKIELNDPLFLPHCSCEISLVLRPGEGVLFSGENGIGKSTLLNRFHEILKPEKTAYLPQKELDFFFDRTLGKLKKIFLDANQSQLDSELFETLWSLFQLNLREERKLSQLSGGEAQSLKICLTLSKKADYFLLDEPFQFLDQSRREKLTEFILELQAKLKNIILVEHHLNLPLKEWRTLKLINDQGVLKLGDSWST